MKESTPIKVWPQYLLTLLCNLGTISFGLNIGWLAPLEPSLTSNSTSPLGEDAVPLTTEEISWIGALPAVSFLLGTPIFGYILLKTGRRFASFLATLPNILCFTILLFSYNVYMIYAARFICGFSSAGTLIVTPIYVNESTRDDIRGFLCGLSGLFINIGVIIVFILGGYTSYVVSNTICLGFSLLFLLFYVWLPESPVYLLSKNKTKEAAESLQKLRGGSKDDILEEISRMSKAIGENQHKKNASLKTLVTNKESRYALFIVMGIMTIQQLCGIAYIVGYTHTIFAKSGSSLSPSVAAILTSVMQLFGSAAGAYLVDRAGRKSLLMISTVIMAISLSSLSAFVLVKDSFEDFSELMKSLGWIPSAVLMMYIGAYAIGYGTVPFVLIPELFRPESRGMAGALGGSFVSLLAFKVIKFFPLITEQISLAGSFGIFALCSAMGSIFIYFVLFETKGKKLEEILSILKNRSECSIFSRKKEKYIEKIELKNSRYKDEKPPLLSSSQP